MLEYQQICRIFLVGIFSNNNHEHNDDLLNYYV